jgi:excisionase family DNA binding protein
MARLTLSQVAEALGVHYMTVYRHVRTGRLPAERVGGIWQVESADLDLARRGRPSGGGRPVERRPPTRARLQARLVAGDEAGAWGIVEAALASDMDRDAVLLGLIGAAMRAIGTAWEAGELSVADEHRASAVAIRLISRLSARFARRGRKRGSVVLCAPAGELHAVPVAMAADLLRWLGFEVVELGADTPADAIAQAAGATPELLAIGLACTTEASCRSARRAFTTLRRRLPGVPLLCGGAAVSGPDHARRLGADEFTGARADVLARAVERLAEERAPNEAAASQSPGGRSGPR